MLKLGLLCILFFGAWCGINMYCPHTMWQEGFHVAGHLVSYSLIALGAVLYVGYKKIK